MIKTKIEKLEKSEIEIIGGLEWVEFEKYQEKALLRIGERLELPGFRKGKAPIAKVKENIPEMELLQEMAEKAIADNYPKILEENKILAIGRPEVTITKIAKGSELEFKIKTAILPEMKLPDYKKIAKEQNKKEDFKKEIKIEETEVEKIILDLRKMRLAQRSPKGEVGAKKHDHSDPNHFHEEPKEEDLPVFNDEFAKSFGDFKNADELKEKIKNNLKIEKEIEQKDKLRLATIEEILKNTEGEIPEILIQSETDKILYRLQADVTNAGLKFEDYLKQIKKTEKDLRKEWKVEAEKRAKLQIIIQNISEKENLKPSEKEIQKEVNQIMTTYKEADITRAQAYVEQILQNEKVFQFLEIQK